MDNAKYEVIPPEVLDAVQIAHIFPDSKTFVDKPLKHTKEKISQAFQALDQPVTADKLKEFVQQYFDEEGKDLVPSLPADFVDSPKFLDSITEKRLREFASDLNQKWKVLGRQIKEEVKVAKGMNSLIYLPHPFIVPGGRFREIYYWDSYWVVEGLLVCELTDTVKGMLSNLLYLVDKFGFVPNGNREYYKNRSQPPLLTPMVSKYMQKTDDVDFLRSNILLLEKEYDFWLNKRKVDVTIDGQIYEASIYRVVTDSARPESYREDKSLALDNPTVPAGQLYADLASAAESGWDFSTRWFDVDQPNTELSSISTHDVVPVDLNSFLCWNARILRDFNQKLGNTDKVKYYNSEYVRRMRLIEAVFWDEGRGTWFDYNLKTQRRDSRFYASMIAPIFTGSHGETTSDKKHKVQRVLQYAKATLGSLTGYEAGVPTSLYASGQQWDYPNAWPPLQHMWIHSFYDSTYAEAQEFASSLAQKWVISNWLKWKPNHDMYEKYNAVTGDVGYGGEYEVQEGFGWSNGVILDLLDTFPQMKIPDNIVELSVSENAIVSVNRHP